MRDGGRWEFGSFGGVVIGPLDEKRQRRDHLLPDSQKDYMGDIGPLRRGMAGWLY